MKIYIILIFNLFTYLLIAQEGKKVQFIGGARSILSTSDFTTDEKDTFLNNKAAASDPVLPQVSTTSLFLTKII